MKRLWLLTLLALGAVGASGATTNSVGTLTTTVYPGYYFSANEKLTISKLNRLGLPSVLITGTLDGATNIAASSVSYNTLASGVADGVTITGPSLGPLRLRWDWTLTTNASGVGVRYDSVVMGTNTLGLGIRYDTNVLTTNQLGLTLPATLSLPANSIRSSNIVSQAIYPTNLATTLDLRNHTVQLPASAVFSTVEGPDVNTESYPVTVAHGLTNTPAYLRVVYRCVTGDGGFQPGDEVDVSQVYGYTESLVCIPYIHYHANSSNVVLSVYAKTSIGPFMLIPNPTLSSQTAQMQTDRWKFRLYIGPQ